MSFGRSNASRACAVVVAAAFVFAAPAVADAQDVSSAKHKAAHSRHSGGGMAALVSGFRRSHGLPAVSYDARLNLMARRQTQAMVAHDRMSHDVGGDFGTRLRSSGYQASAAAENIAAGQRSSAEAFAAWVGSSSHRSNLLLGGATRIGFASMAAPKSKYRIYWTLVLAAPAVVPRHAKNGRMRRAPVIDEFHDRLGGSEP
jgi:uncharacterized protein YkwD